MQLKGRGDLGIALSLMFALILTVTPMAQAFAGVTVSVGASTLTMPIGGSRQFTATVAGTSNTAVTWYVNGILGGSSSTGTISANGLYVSPSNLPAGTVVTVSATSAADNTASASCAVTLRNQIPYITSVSPTALPFGPFSITVIGSRYVNGAQVLLNGAPLQTTFVSTTQLNATGSWNTAGNVNISVANPGPAAVSVNYTIGFSSNVAISVLPLSATLQVGGTQQFVATVSNSSNTAVNWQVNGISGGNASVGTISPGGLYSAPPSIPSTGAVTVTAASAADNTKTATASVSIQDPQAISTGRFLEQSTFGPTAQLMGHVRQIGFNSFLDEQFLLPETPLPPVSTGTRQDVIDAFFYNAGTGQDQLRQRVIYALSQIWVVAINKNTNGDMIIPHLQILSKDAFGNYRTLIREMTLSTSMGMYLDLVNSVKPGNGVGANENYPREVMQLFTIGLWQLNPDGSLKKDALGNSIPTYDQTDVQQIARALTGWTYPTPAGKQPTGMNYSYLPGVMEGRQVNHDMTQKTFLGQTLQPNQTITQDLDGTVDILFNHANTGPFLATRLIRSMVTSNPSPAYIQRVAAVFNDNGQGVRGDMQAVIRAVLMDPEARDDNPPASFGKLKSPMLYALGLMRSLGASIPQHNQSSYLYYTFGEGILDPASVFGHFSPNYHIPKTQLFGPEFQIYSPTEAVNRGNYIYQDLNYWSGGLYDITPYINIATDQVQLVNALDNTLLFGRMLPQTRASIYKALQASSDNRARALTAIYLTAMSGEYLVQH